MNVAEAAPAGTVTVCGTEAVNWLLDRLTEIPPVGATPLKMTVPTEVFPPTKLVGLIVSLLRVME